MMASRPMISLLLTNSSGLTIVMRVRFAGTRSWGTAVSEPGSAELLRDRALRVLDGRTVATSIKKVRAIVGPVAALASEVKAQSAVDKFARGETPTWEEIAALEIVIRLLRPVVFVRGGVLEDLPREPGAPHAPDNLEREWDHFRTRANPVLSSIGRIETGAGKHIGTGFLVVQDRLVTNRHVLTQLSYGTDRLVAGLARVVFRQEDGNFNTAADIVAIEDVAAIHPSLDMVLLKIAPQQRPLLPLASTPVKQADKLVVIGFPAHDPENNPLFLNTVFGGKFGYKRAAIGEVLDGTASPIVFHDASTTKGNSGSPIFSLKEGNVVGVHKSGVFLYRNDAVDSGALGKFIAQAGG
jgi:S1-C subfamily serine protease